MKKILVTGSAGFIGSNLVLRLLKGETIKIFNYGNCKRDFTFVEDIVEGVQRVMHNAPEKRVGADGLPLPPYKVYNIGNFSPATCPSLSPTPVLSSATSASGHQPRCAKDCGGSPSGIRSFMGRTSYIRESGDM